MVTLDRRKLTAPLLAQAAAFVAVLAIGVAVGHGEGKHPHGRPTPSTTLSGHPRTTSPGPVPTTPSANTSTADSTELSAVIEQVDSFGLVMPGLTVEVFKDNPTLTHVLTVHLPEGIAGTQELLGIVPAGQNYQVCVEPPSDWKFTDQSTRARPGWDCAKVDATLAAQTVRFHLLPKSLTTGTGA